MAVIAFAHVLLSRSLEGVHKCCSTLCVSVMRPVCKGSNVLILPSVACQVDISKRPQAEPPPRVQMLYIQMEFCPRTLREVLDRGPLSPEDCWQVNSSKTLSIPAQMLALKGRVQS